MKIYETLNFYSRRRRHPQSVCSEDGRCIGGANVNNVNNNISVSGCCNINNNKQYANGSFRSAGSGCAKLKRHNACRQKTREFFNNTTTQSITTSPSSTSSTNQSDNNEIKVGATFFF